MTPQPDFLRPVRGPHRLAWLACATACTVLAIAATDALEAWSALQDAAPPDTVVAAPRSMPAPSEADRQLQAALAQLQRPWPQAFAALDGVQVAGAFWLALDIGDAGRLRLQGQAADARTAQRAAEALRQAGAWRDALLGRIENNTGTQGNGVDFEITAEARP